MLTDDDLTTRLRADFERATADLHFTRRVAPPRPRTGLLLAPAATLVGAAAVGAVVLGQPAAAPSPSPPVATGAAKPSIGVSPSPSQTARASGRLVTIRFAGYVMTYRRSAGTDDRHAMSALVSDPVPVPSGARTVTNTDGVEGSVARYPGTTRAALWVKLPTVEGGRPVALVSTSLTEDQLIDLWRHASSAAH